MEAMNPVMRVGTGSVPSALHTTGFTMADDVEVVPTFQGRFMGRVHGPGRSCIESLNPSRTKDENEDEDD